MELMVCVVRVISCIGCVLFIAAACCLQAPCIMQMQADAGRTAGSLRTPRPRHSELSSILWLCACIYASNRFGIRLIHSKLIRQPHGRMRTCSWALNLMFLSTQPALHACAWLRLCSLVGFWVDKSDWYWFVVRGKYYWLADKPWLKPILMN